MNEKGTSIREAQNRSMNFQERFSFLVFIGKFLVSKFGLFFLFLILHLLSSYQAKNNFIKLASLKEEGTKSLVVSSTESFVNNENSSQDQNHNLFPVNKNKEKTQISMKEGTNSLIFHSPQIEKAQLIGFENQISLKEIGCFQKIKYYCIIATIVTLFLNPQQTKYFGGLAVVLKQAGFFTKYGKSEKMVYIFSWVFVILFFYSSIDLSKIARSLT